jgi:RluA family pseudouridine synthase
VKLITTSEQAGLRLDHALADWLPQALGRPVSKAKTRKLVMAGAIRVNGRPVRNAAKTLAPHTTLEALIDLTKLFDDSTSRDRKFELTGDRILFEDDDLIVIDKPPGLPAQPTVDENRDNLFTALKRFLSRERGFEDPYLGVHQRLDRDTSGAVLFTKSQRVNAAIADVFAKRQGVKIYQALTVPRPESGLASQPRQEWTIRNQLGRVMPKLKQARYGAVRSGGVHAETSFRVLAEYPRGVWLKAIPKTGRTHQIRVHLFEYGLPILGDDLYGPAVNAAPRLMLHAVELSFLHPITRREISVKSEPPADFRKCLKQLASNS